MAPVMLAPVALSRACRAGSAYGTSRRSRLGPAGPAPVRWVQSHRSFLYRRLLLRQWLRRSGGACRPCDAGITCNALGPNGADCAL